MNIPVPITSFELGYGASKSQDLGITPKQLQEFPNRPGYYTDGFYTLNFSVANEFPSYPGYYIAKLSFGTQELADAEGWGTGVATAVTVICPGPAYIVADKALPGGGPVQAAKNLVLDFTVNDGSVNGGWPLKFSNISLTFTPTN